MSYNNNARSAYNSNSKTKSANEIGLLDSVTRHLVSLEKDFITAAAWNPTLSFAKESVFAKHVINNNPYLTQLASGNPKSFEVAFLQLATSGLTLDPSQKMAYLVPRMGKVFLDVSYLGLARMATDEGLCDDIVVELVFETDQFHSNGRRQSPDHSFDPFATKGDLILTPEEKGVPGDRGAFRGVYVDYRMKDGRNLVYFLTKSEINASRSVSESWKNIDKRDSSPWTKFPWQMVCKSAIKQTIYQIPGNRSRTSSIIQYLNEDGGEGFRNANAVHIQSAEVEMSARRTAQQFEQAPSGNVYEGEIAPETATPETANPETANPETVNSNDTNATKQDITTPESQPASAENPGEVMSDIPGVRESSMRRISKLTMRVERTLAYETMIADVKTSFEFNDSEIKYAIWSLEQSRRLMLQNKLTEAVTKCDFSEVDKFISELTDCEFKNKSAELVRSIHEQTAKLRYMYDEAINSNDYTLLETEIESIGFEPLKKLLTDMIQASKAA